MGLRFRKSISLIPGVRLNFSKSGMSVSSGVPGFRKTINTKGQVTTTVGIPGTGLYYVDTKKAGNKQSSRNRNDQTPASSEHSQPDASYVPPVTEACAYNSGNQDVNIHKTTAKQVDVNTLKSIHKTADDTIDWTEILVSPSAPDNSYNQQMWSYYYSVAPDVLRGDIDTYLKLIYEVNPLDDLLDYGTNFEFGTDDSDVIEVEFTVNSEVLSQAQHIMRKADYNDLLQDFICSLSIRIARDMFALLPINHTIVHTVMNNQTILSVDFDKCSLSKVKFGFIDPSDTVLKYKHNMIFNSDDGFSEVCRI
ncbi:MAG: DUF4236 domain-containing protein [Ruminococcus sp.]|nr:DUF4236 domain-containing protein [Ruminococcus sp.]